MTGKNWLVMGIVAMAITTGVVRIAQAFNPQPDPPEGLIVCEAQDRGTITVKAFDGFRGDRIAVGMSCMTALSEVRRKGQKFEVNSFDGLDGAAKFGIIIVNSKPAEF